jgi:uncharacterized paraquat-inducible protein A
MRWTLALNLALLVLFPIAWVAPLLRAGLNLPLLGLDEISVISGLVALWGTDRLLALLVALFAVVAPVTKIALLAAVQTGRLGPRALPVLHWLGKLAMADIFLIALYVVVIKGVAMTRVEVGWGLYLFTFCVLASLALSLGARRG